MPHRRAIYLATLEAHIDRLHSQVRSTYVSPTIQAPYLLPALLCETLPDRTASPRAIQRIELQGRESEFIQSHFHVYPPMRLPKLGELLVAATASSACLSLGRHARHAVDATDALSKNQSMGDNERLSLPMIQFRCWNGSLSTTPLEIDVGFLFILQKRMQS